jgi:type IV pilus assembly protein PilB
MVLIRRKPRERRPHIEQKLHAREEPLTTTIRRFDIEEEERLAAQRAATLRVPYINFFGFPINPDAVGLIPEEEARLARVVCFYRYGRNIRLGAVNPFDEKVQRIADRLADEEGFRVRVFLISERSLEQALKLYRKTAPPPEEGPGSLVLPTAEMSEFEYHIKTIKDLGKRLHELPTTEVLNTIVAGAVKIKASDIHIEPKADHARLRYRIDGVLQDITTFDLVGWRQILSRVKVLGGLKLNIHDQPQDGSFVIELEEGKHLIDVRLSILPGGFGESIVMRLLDRQAQALDIYELGMKLRDIQLILEELKKPNGMILNTGPTGSGKTTTLAAFLSYINDPKLKIITLEDPIEYRIPGIQQTQVNEEEGYTFSRGLRSILRQDPDVILVGEIRDTDTAQTAMHGALTGHVLFTTLHTNDAPGAIPRLIDMGVDPRIMAPALNAVIAQRLVRRVCLRCKEEYKPSAAEIKQVREAMKGVIPEVFDPRILDDSALRFVRGRKCGACNHTGYRGRIGVFEIYSVRDELEDLVLRGADTNTIREAALRQGMTTIAQDGMLKVIDRITTIEEVERISEE